MTQLSFPSNQFQLSHLFHISTTPQTWQSFQHPPSPFILTWLCTYIFLSQKLSSLMFTWCMIHSNHTIQKKDFQNCLLILPCYCVILTFAYANRLQDKWQSFCNLTFVSPHKIQWGSWLIEQKKENTHIQNNKDKMKNRI